MQALCLLAFLAVAAEPDAQARAEAERIQAEVVQLARRNAWSGVERAYRELEASDAEIEQGTHRLGAEAARALGDAWGAYRRLQRVIAMDSQDDAAHAALVEYRSSYGRVTIQRVEPTAIELEAVEAPFLPDRRRAIGYARERLQESGGFDGMLPVGRYRLGPHDLHVEAGLAPTILRREPGDGRGRARED